MRREATGATRAKCTGAKLTAIRGSYVDSHRQQRAGKERVAEDSNSNKSTGRPPVADFLRASSSYLSYYNTSLDPGRCELAA